MVFSKFYFLIKFIDVFDLDYIKVLIWEIKLIFKILKFKVVYYMF